MIVVVVKNQHRREMPGGAQALFIAGHRYMVEEGVALEMALDGDAEEATEASTPAEMQMFLDAVASSKDQRELDRLDAENAEAEKRRARIAAGQATQSDLTAALIEKEKRMADARAAAPVVAVKVPRAPVDPVPPAPPVASAAVEHAAVHAVVVAE